MQDVKKVTDNDVKKPHGDILIVYYSSLSQNTHRFVLKTGQKSIRIPYDLNEEITVDQDYILISPTYSGGGEITEGAVPKQVIKFLNNKQNRDHCYGVIGSGNTNFNNTFAIAGTILSKKLNVPLLYQFELLGTAADVKNVNQILENFFVKK